ncbi:MAG: thioredoxin domain-containing protein, partial [candidate division WOR-3 bacterium]
MRLRHTLALCIALTLFLCMTLPIGGSASPATADAQPFPSYGSGKVTVRLYTDYFCPPCRAMEPSLEPLIHDLVKRNAIRLTFVDTPIYQYSPEYARYFLYALNKKNEFEHALRVRQILFRAAEEKLIQKEQFEERLKKNGIEWSAFDVKSTLQRFDALMNEDKINATPTAVVINGGKKET